MNSMRPGARAMISGSCPKVARKLPIRVDLRGLGGGMSFSVRDNRFSGGYKRCDELARIIRALRAREGLRPLAPIAALEALRPLFASTERPQLVPRLEPDGFHRADLH